MTACLCACLGFFFPIFLLLASSPAIPMITIIIFIVIIETSPASTNHIGCVLHLLVLQSTLRKKKPICLPFARWIARPEGRNTQKRPKNHHVRPNASQKRTNKHEQQVSDRKQIEKNMEGIKTNNLEKNAAGTAQFLRKVFSLRGTIRKTHGHNPKTALPQPLQCSHRSFGNHVREIPTHRIPRSSNPCFPTI